MDLSRVPWSASLVVDLTDPPEGIPAIGPFLERREWFRDLMVRWLNATGRPIKRSAFAGALVARVDSRFAAYERLNQHLRLCGY